MKTLPSRSDAMIRFNVTQQLRGMRWYIALVVALAIILAGVFRGGDRHGFLGIALEIAFVVAFNYGIAQDRITGFDDFAFSFLPPRLVFIGKLMVATALWVAFTAIVLFITVILWREPRAALWHVGHAFLLLGFLMPVALVCETLIDVKYSSAIALAFTGVLVLSVVGSKQGEHFFNSWGLNVTPGSFQSLERLAIVGIIWNLALTIVAYSVWATRHRHIRSCID